METNPPVEGDDPRYKALLQRYQELELRVTRFSAVEQQLVQARDRLDREMAIHSRMHVFNTAAFKEMPPPEFARLVAESLVDVFEVELGFYCAASGPDGSGSSSAAHGGQIPAESHASIFDELNALVPGRPKEWASALVPAQLERLQPFVNLREAMAVVLRDEHSQPLLALLVGNTEERSGFYERIPAERKEALTVFAQQIAAHMANQSSRHTIRTQVEQIRRSEERLRRLGDNLPNGVVFQLEVDDGGHRRFLYLSAGVQRIHKLSAEEVRADPSRLYDQIVQEDRGLFDWRERDALASNKPFAVEVRIRNAVGELKWIYINSALTRQAGNTVRWDGLELDITERKRLEDRLQQAQKMEGIGHLAGGVAHEFNNLLAAMVMNLSLARIHEAAPESRELLGEVENLCKRASNLVKQLLAFSRQSVMHLQPVELDTAVAEECRMLGRLLGERIRLECSTTSNLPPVLADRSMIGQVLLNLCLNARDAMPQGGLLKLQVDPVEITSQQASEQLEVAPGHYVCLSVSDTGCGMDDRTKQRLFEPFFTTKDVGQGTGLGLATVRGIVQQHRGCLSVESTLGVGTTFRIYLPTLSSLAPAPDPLRHPSVAGSRRSTLLVVEDEATIRKSTARYLQHLGYRVLEAATAAEALIVWREHHRDIDLLYTDMVMPGEMTGLQLAERVLAEKPGLKVILTTGYNTQVLDACKASRASLTFLAKPSMPEELRDTIARCLQAD